ncbi:hypothetical protein ARMGADRAFT_1070641 [Armillaria gallica]|uniref:Uncharacterized protein n=1 Tax=Armillaria gallica TaxID=47427 RepID=A0A2H3ENQ9_ARMGA|nr:hypothetical protein ARMGADRAFT_1070641 [Armillaria gallica]
MSPPIQTICQEMGRGRRGVPTRISFLSVGRLTFPDDLHSLRCETVLDRDAWNFRFFDGPLGVHNAPGLTVRVKLATAFTLAAVQRNRLIGGRRPFYCLTFRAWLGSSSVLSPVRRSLDNGRERSGLFACRSLFSSTFGSWEKVTGNENRWERAAG